MNGLRGMAWLLVFQTIGELLSRGLSLPLPGERVLKWSLAGMIGWLLLGSATSLVSHAPQFYAWTKTDLSTVAATTPSVEQTAKLIRDHVVVSAIAPGPFQSDMNRAARDNADEVATRVPAGRIGTDEDMAGAAIYLASRAGDYVVGATIAVDGGIVYANPGIKGDGWD